MLHILKILAQAMIFVSVARLTLEWLKLPYHIPFKYAQLVAIWLVIILAGALSELLAIIRWLLEAL